MNDNLEEMVKYTRLLSIYGSLLTKKIFKRLDLYLNQDYSISEIAFIENTSRNACYDSIKSGINTLEKFEENLLFQQRLNNLYELVAKKDQQLLKDVVAIMED